VFHQKESSQSWLPPSSVRHAALETGPRQDYIASMDTVPRPDDRADPPVPETEVERQRRIAWEAAGIAEASLAAGFYVDADEIDAWIDSIGTDHQLPPPPTRRR